jgi:hypothetical protein
VRVLETFLAERAGLIETGNRLRDEARDLSDRRDESRWEPERLLRDRVEELHHRYQDLLPDVTVARCPFSGALVHWSLDTIGLDGWAWEYEHPTRRVPDLPPLWLAMNGAMRLSEPVEYTSEQVRPGPGVPYVVPRILRRKDVRAVIAQIPVGRHTGWAISYFGPQPKGVTLVNDWGGSEYYVYDDTGEWLGWDRDEDGESVGQYDFALASWLKSGKLLWIAPGDESTTLRGGVEGCPYIGLTGQHGCAWVFRGKLWYPGMPVD